MQGAVLVSGSVHGVLDDVTRGVDTSFVKLEELEQRGRKNVRVRKGIS